MATEKTIATHYAITRTCRTCQGHKVVPGPITCPLCGAEFPPDEMDDVWAEGDAALLPCGHPANNLVEQLVTCPECGGHGHSQQWISQAEWQHIQRQRWMRGLVLLAVTLLLIFTLVGVVSSRDPDYVCGSWWYGLIPFWFIIWRY